MADYISRQKAIEAIMDLPNCPNGYSDTYDKACIIGMLEEVQTADVVEVVRCKDCKYFVDEGMYCENNIITQFDHFYCYYGERREDGNN